MVNTILGTYKNYFSLNYVYLNSAFASHLLKHLSNQFVITEDAFLIL
jgi:hypothetical protein